MPEHDLLEQALASWRCNNEVNLRLIAKLPKRGLKAVPYGSRGRDVGRQLVHLHNVRLRWLEFNKAEEFEKLAYLPTKETPTFSQLKSNFKRSGAAVEKFLKRVITTGKRTSYFKGQPIRWMSYMISHESHHRGSIMLALKQNGMRMPNDVAITDLWFTWYYAEV